MVKEFIKSITTHTVTIAELFWYSIVFAVLQIYLFVSDGHLVAPYTQNAMTVLFVIIVFLSIAYVLHRLFHDNEFGFGALIAGLFFGGVFLLVLDFSISAGIIPFTYLIMGISELTLFSGLTAMYTALWLLKLLAIRMKKARLLIYAQAPSINTTIIAGIGALALLIFLFVAKPGTDYYSLFTIFVWWGLVGGDVVFDAILTGPHDKKELDLVQMISRKYKN